MYESPQSPGKKVSLLNFLLTIVLVLAGFAYLILTGISHDPLWFWPTFSARPSYAVVRCYGQQVVLNGDSAHVEALALLVNSQLSGDKSFDTLGLTTPTYQYYLNDPGVMTLELVYASPVRVHLPNMYFTGINSLLLPLDGRYASSSTVFGLIDGVPGGGSIHVQSNQAIVDYLAGQALCVKPRK